ncbi:AAA family ATPase [Flavobacterium sp. KACC 22758]|jgi:AAA15 family ATPase/GTPase|uniref:AAA family ATPase n=1 Tax=Flavobacterium sp. KACC 22758 TaxID=3025667 RepID=UPI00236511F8|nr:AAA family ATPase [Flavobacterium sp. KACC 22758]WDF57840.1 AAA family ATPase [Flavobacterium sp. KACC 22758]
MLIRFSVENFLSFSDRQVFSLIPGKGTLKSEHKTKKIRGVSLLKTSVIFGANASGKSNLIKAIDFGQKLVLKGTKSETKIDYQNFRLDLQAANKYSRIEYELQHKGKNYAYGFTFNSDIIKEEWLYEITIKNDNKIFERNIEDEEIFDLDNITKKIKSQEEQQFLKFIAKGTPNNQLFLNEIRTRKVKENVSQIDDLLNVIDWFQNSLKVIFPEDKYNEGLKFELKQDEELLTTFEQFLEYFDTGINGVCLEKVDFESVDVPKSILNRIKEDLLSKKSENFRASILSIQNTTYFLSVKDNDLVYEKFMTKHLVKGKKELEKFDTSDESDGTNRIMDFIPLMMDLLKGDNVFIIDEMERSLHPNLIYDLIDLFISKAVNVNSQLILASHESSLLTQKLLRKDEVWFVVKDNFGSSKLHSLEDYNIRFDKEIRKDYLLGRFKAIPRIGNRSRLTILNKSNL